MTMDTQSMLELLQQTAEDVIRPRFRALNQADIAEKQPGDYVTIADRESEIAITEVLRREYPNALIVGEEATAADPALMHALPKADHAFVVDPVDGTRNFVEGSPDYAVMVGELVGGEIVRGWIWQPEHQQAWVAERGAGVQLNGQKVTRGGARNPVRGQSSQRSLLGELPGPVSLDWTAYSCGIDYPNISADKIDFLIYRHMKPWDHVPGSLMVTETGGISRLSSGETYRGQLDGGPLLIAADDYSWELARRCLRPGAENEPSD